MNSECIFCRIVQKEAEADSVFDGGDTLFFRDISPKAAVHIVGIPKKHITSVGTLQPEDQAVMGKLLLDISQVAKEADLHDSGYRVITNIGPDSGQAVEHLHFHILGGEPLGPLRC